MQKREKGCKGSKKKWILAAIILSLFIILLASAAAVVMIDNRHVLFYITGEQEMELAYGQEYTEPGVYAVSTGELFGEFEKHLSFDECFFQFWLLFGYFKFKAKF